MEVARVKTELSYGERRGGFIGFLALFAIFALFYFIKIDSAVIAQGQVLVQGKPRPVQSLEGGVVRDIKVNNGDRVEAGQVVVQLDPALAEINRDIMRGRLAELIAREVRLDTERRQLDTFPPLQVGSYVDTGAVKKHLSGQQELFQSRRAVLESQYAQLKELKLQHEAQIKGLEAQIVASQQQSAFITREVKNLETLLAQGLVPESRLLELQGRKAGILGQIALHQSEISRMRNSIRDADLEITQTEREFREKVITEQRDVAAKISENLLELARTEAQMKQLEIRSPVTGIVHEMQIWTSGGVIPPLETLMSVVPISQGVDFEVQVPPDAIDTVYLGQEARVRFPAFDQRSTPELTGSISGVSPDSVTDPSTGRSFYRVNVALSDTELERLGEAELLPGMPVEVFLQTGNQSILSYLLNPLMDQLSYTFRES
ncbi:HlyD family type I secretion periplasmic adaptor subunit [uncultured Shimia sp.]|uniref:HlyD family type I secretion periplasmic adaptor subunit n=1 Tax=uncultured Shimia sp. TaxID=573152 RepID=UPI00262EBAF6|nr:HlyD family type I secretion periplasmic adaptor subunit [uncultured Shimia sp.]